MQVSWWWILDLSQMNIFVMTALMQLLSFFEKHLPGINFLSGADPIIYLANIILLIQLKSASRRHIALNLWIKLLSTIFSSSTVSPIPQRARGIPCRAHAVRYAACIAESIKWDAGNTTEWWWCPFIYPFPILLEVRCRNCGRNLSARHTWKGMLSLLQNLLCPNVGIGWVFIHSLKYLLGAFCVTHET